ncbi:unnamed protein product [Didymodactylos carnosus]|uniref:LamG-like jellyroll fold domain-containing protein n=1 Tax=Didymodactylos carnosus TaxID=1234261 RepID=A0A8S2GFK6_9BILA|nr:unnamed protein product [Didymodactylos carnosus]CAF3508604.1 unnamed protein product [Didymodactylos carnosus]
MSDWSDNQHFSPQPVLDATIPSSYLWHDDRKSFQSFRQEFGLNSARSNASFTPKNQENNTSGILRHESIIQDAWSDTSTQQLQSSRLAPVINRIKSSLSWKRVLFEFALVLLFSSAIILPIVLPYTVANTGEIATTMCPTATPSIILTSTTASTSTSVTTTTSTALASCTSSCVNTTITTSSNLLALYPFDSNTNDQQNMYNGVINNGAAFSQGYVLNAIYLNGPSQFVSATYIDLTYKSFTIETWFYLTALNTSDANLFGECAAAANDQCLHLVIRNKYLFMGFYHDDCAGSTVLSTGQWYHAAFVYDYTNLKHLVYLNGNLDGSTGPSTGPYIGQSGAVTIGFTGDGGGVFYYQGYIDQLSVTARAKTACEILNDATLVSHFSFDNTWSDSGPNSLPYNIPQQGNPGMSIVTGHKNQALLFGANSAFFQSYSYTALGTINQPYTLALWIKPTYLNGTVLHLSSDSTGAGGWVIPVMGFTSASNFAIHTWTGSSTYIVGPILPLENWTHVVQTWGTSYGLRLYINGVPYASVTAATFNAAQSQMYLTVGNSLAGGTYNVGPFGGTTGAFWGAVDEFYVYSRELTAEDVCVLFRM